MNKERVSKDRKEREELLIYILRHYYLLRGTHKDVDSRIEQLIESLKNED